MDPRLLPAYAPLEAAHYLGIPVATLRAWTRGQNYWVGREKRRFKPVIRLPDSHLPSLSFVNLIEAHVLESIRRHHRISLQRVRPAIRFLEREFGSEHPLAEHDFATSGLNLFVERYGELISLTQHGQLGLMDILKAYLRRVERNPDGDAIRLFPFTRKTGLDQPRIIVIDPSVAFGRPVLAGTGIPTAVISERYKAGESVQELAVDYMRSKDEIEEAIRCELQAA